jgi:phosphoglycolate phosphatase
LSGEPPISLACCGLLGTVAQDNGMLEHAFAEACATQGIVPGTADYAHYMVTVHQSQGQPAVDVFRGLFPGNPGRAEAAALSFERSFRAAVDRTGLEPVPGAGEAIAELRAAGVRICVISGLSRRLVGLILDSLDWWRRIDLALSPDDVPRGCPWPDLMLAAMLRLGVEDVRAAAYAGSTASGVECARRAGAGIIAGVLTGGHTRDRLRSAGATHFISEIAELPALLAGEDAEAGQAREDPEPLKAAEDGATTRGAGKAETGHDAAGRGATGRAPGERGVARRVPPQASAPRIAPAPQVP